MRTQQVEIIIFCKDPKGEILFLLLKRNPKKGGFWQPVTGGVEENESIEQAAFRELKEELNITNYLQFLDTNYSFTFQGSFGPLTEYVFGVEIEYGAPYALSEEHTTSQWVSFERALLLLKWDSNRESLRNLYRLLISKTSS